MMEGRLTFRRDLEVSRFDDQGDRDTVVLRDPVSAKFYYLSSYEYQLLEAFDGTMTFEEALAELAARGRYYAREDAKAILAKVAQSGLVLGTKFGTAEYQKELKQRSDVARKAQLFSSVYFLFIPLVNPDRFLEKTLKYVRPLVTRWTATILALALPGAVYLLLSDVTRIHSEYLYFFNLQNLVCLWITLALTKLIHELAHAYTAKSFGLRVPVMGVAFLIFFPCLFCNTTEAWGLANRKQRIAISAAGILVEAAIAIVAVYIWYFSQPGVVNSLAFYLMAISFFSTILFNGNPLMRFDGYFVLMDLLRLPNLYTRSFAHVRYLFLNRVLGLVKVPAAASNLRENTIFTVYGVSAFLYRILLYASIVAGVYYRFDKLLGFLLGVAAFALFIARPLIKGGASLFRQRHEIHVQRTEALAMAGLALVLLLVLFIPLKRTTTFHCYLAASKSQKLSVPLHTAVDRVFVEDGSTVKAGEVLFTLDTTRLRNLILQKRLEGALLRKEMEVLSLDPRDMAWASSKAIQLRRLSDEITRINRDLQVASDGICAPFNGVITKLDHRVQYGFQPGEGAVVGEVESSSDCVVHVLIPENDLHRIKRGDRGSIWFRHGSGVEMEGLVSEIRPYSEQDLKDSPFSSRFGGEFATEPREDRRTDAPLEALYVAVVTISGNSGIPLGMTGKFFVLYAPQSLAGSFLEQIGQAFQRERLL